MIDLPRSLSSDEPNEYLGDVIQTFKDLYENRIGGGDIGDVFKENGDIMTLAIKENSGLFKNSDGELDFLVTASAISNTPSGNIKSTNVQSAINELGEVKVQSNAAPPWFTTIKFPATSVPAPQAGKAILFMHDLTSSGYGPCLRIIFPNGTVKTIAHSTIPS